MYKSTRFFVQALSIFVVANCHAQVEAVIQNTKNSAESFKVKRDAASLIEACFMNISSVERGDVLLRINRTEDSVAEVGVHDLSVFSDSLEFHRIVFDFSKGKLFYASSSEKNVVLFNKPDSEGSDDPKTVRTIKGLFINGSDKFIFRMPDKVRKLNEKTLLVDAIRQIDMPDVRLFGISPFGSGNFVDVKNSLSHYHGDHITQIENLNGGKKQINFRFVDTSEPNEQGIDTEFLIDTENLVPLKIVNSFVSGGRRGDEWSVETIEWQTINDTTISKKVRRDAKVHSRVAGVLHPHPLVQIAEIHCFSLNEEIDESIFEVKNFVKLDQFLKMCDPQATDATTLLRNQKEVDPNEK